MATDLQSTKNGTLKSISKYEGYVDEHLSLARRRIRLLDLAAGGLGLLVLTFAYGLLMALLDRKMEFSSLTRQVLFGVYGIAAAVYIYFMMALPLMRRINPYYAARRIEATLPEAKNSVVNYLDLRRETIPAAFRSAIGLKAAKDLAQADFEEAISARRTSWLGGGVCGLLLALLIVYVMSPQQFVSLMRRAFAPFIEASIATRTRISLVNPENGDLTIPVGRAVSISVWVDGKIPDASSAEALKLHYRYSDTDPYESRPLEQGDGPRQWLTTVRAGEVHNGFWYKIGGGDTETPEYRVEVHSSPLLTGFDVTYHYRPYLGWRDRLAHDQNLQALRGTEVTIVAHTNRKVKDGQLVITDQNPISAELSATDADALRFRLKPLDKDGEYRIWFTAADGERNVEPLPYKIRVLHDQTPVVELKKPGKDVELPANSILQLEGSASDDHGVAGMTLQMRLRDQVLEAKPYRAGKPLVQGDGSLPLMLAYKDFVELSKIRRADGGPVKLDNEEIEYWLEAKDNCDYPAPNIGASPHYKVKIQQPNPDKKQQQEAQKQKQEAQKEQQQHEQKQDQQLKEQKKEPQPDQPKQDTPPDQQPPQSGEPEKSQPKSDQDQNPAAQKQSKPDQSQDQNQTEQQKSGQANDQNPSDPNQQNRGKPQKQKDGADKSTQPDQPKDQQKDKADSGNPKDGPGQDGSNQKQNNLSEEEKNLQQTANRLKEALEKQKQRERAEGQPQNGNKQNPADKPEKSNAGQEQGTKPDQNRAQNKNKPDPNSTGAQNSQAQQDKPKDQAAPRDPGDKGEKPADGERNSAKNDQSPDAKKPNGKNEARGNPGPKKGEKENSADPSKNTGAEGQKVKDDASKKDGTDNQQPGNEDKNPAKKEKPDGPNTKGSQGKNSANGEKTGSGSEQNPAGTTGDGAKKEQAAKQNTTGSPKDQEVDPKLKDGEREQIANAKEKRDKEGQANNSKPKPGQDENGPPAGTNAEKKGQSSQDKQKPENGQQSGAPKTQAGEKQEKPDPGKNGNEEGAGADGKKTDGEKKNNAGQPKTGERKDATEPKNDAGKPKQDGQQTANGKQAPEKKASNAAGAQGKGKPEQGADPSSKPDARAEAPRPGEGSAKQQGKGKDGAGEGNDEAKTADGKGQQKSSRGGRGGSGGGGSPGDERAGSVTPNNQQGGGASEPAEKGEAANLEFQKKAGDLLLPKKIDKDLLKQAGIASQEDYEKFRQAYLEMLKRQARTPEEKEKLAAPLKGNRTMPNQGVRLVQPAEKANAGDLNRMGHGEAPKKFREAYKQFNKDVSEMSPPPGKK